MVEDVMEKTAVSSARIVYVMASAEAIDVIALAHDSAIETAENDDVASANWIWTYVVMNAMPKGGRCVCVPAEHSAGVV